MRYGLPLVTASILLQLIPLANRLIVSGLYGIGETGQFSLANDLGVRILSAIGSTLDVLLFQLAVRADESHGAEGAGAQLADNMAVVFAVILPTCAGLWLVLPSFQAIIVPEAFRGPFAIYLSAMLPGLLCYGLMQFGLAPIFQIGKRTAPMIVAALSACVTDVVLLAALPRGADGAWLAIAQSASLGVALLVVLVLAASTKPTWPSALDVLSTLVAAAAMAAVVCRCGRCRPARWCSSRSSALGGLVYGGVAYALDVARLRGRIGALVKARAWRIPEQRNVYDVR